MNEFFSNLWKKRELLALNKISYWRVFKESFRYRLCIAGVIFSALMVSVLWGGNIVAVVYPITEICMKKDRTFRTWLDDKIAEYKERIEETTLELQKLKAENKNRSTQIAHLKKQIQRYQAWELWYQWLRPYVQKYTPDTSFMTIVWLVVFIAVMTTIKSAFFILNAICGAIITCGTTMRIREQVHKKVLEFEPEYFARDGVSDVMSRMINDMGILTNGIGALYGTISREPLRMIVCLVMAAYISWQLLLVTLIIFPVGIYAIRRVLASLMRAIRRNLELTSKLFGRIEETYRSIRIVQSFNREPFERSKFHKVNYANYRGQLKVLIYGAFGNPLFENFGIAAVCVGILAGSYLVMGERTHIFGVRMLADPMDTGTLITFFGLLVGAADPARRLREIFGMFASGSIAANRVYELIDRQSPIHDTGNAVSMPKHSDSIKFEHIVFEYNKDKPVLKDVSLDIKFGECVAVVGASGSGKSTFVNLLLRFIEAKEGNVFIDGKSIKDIKIRSLREQISLVAQEPVLFNESVWNNIRYGRPDATKEEIVQAAQQSYAHDFILKELPDGYDSIVGPGGSKLSGGQRQRIALARAMIRNPPIFVLDEATSQIDIQSERMIHQALQDFKQNRTTIMITHRMSALALADRVVFMNEGQIVAIGKHEDLLNSSNEYARFHGQRSGEPVEIKKEHINKGV